METDQAKALRLVSMYSLLNVLIVFFALIIGAFCFEAAATQKEWECFRATVPVAVLPALVCTLLAWVLYLTRKYNSAIVVSAIPTLQVTLWCGWWLAESSGLAR